MIFSFIASIFAPKPKIFNRKTSGFYSPHIKLITDYKKEISNYLEGYIKDKSKESNQTFLDVGGRKGEYRHLAEGFDYKILDIDTSLPKDNITIIGDICNCPEIQDETFDVVFSNNVFEHLLNPFNAANECIRILKESGIIIIIAPFACRYHPSPEDLFRYTHRGLEELFEREGLVRTILSGYDISGRRDNKIGGKLKDGLDATVVDEFGGWRENWQTIYIGKKTNGKN